MIKAVLLSFAVLFVVPSFGGEIRGVKMAESIKVGDKTLVLNGMGLRKVFKFGFPIKVYVAGLYLEKKSKDSNEILKSSGTKQIIMEFLRSVDKDKLVNAWEKGVKRNCFDNCDKLKDPLKEFNKSSVSVRKGNRVAITFNDDGIEQEATGPYAGKGSVKSPELSRNMLAVFIHDKDPPGKDFRKGLLDL